MFKKAFVFTLIVLIAMQCKQIAAFKIITYTIGAPVVASASTQSSALTALPAPSPNAISDNINAAVTAKLNAVNALVGSVASLKAAVAGSVLNSLSGVLSQKAAILNSVASAKLGALNAAPAAVVSAQPVRVTKSIGYLYGK